MDFFRGRHLLGLKNWAPRRVRAVSEFFTKLSGQDSRRFFAVVYFLVSIVLGYFASISSRENAIEWWEKTFLPTERMIQVALASRGFRVPKEEILSRKALRSLPLSLDQKGAIWLSFVPLWCAVFLSDNDAELVRPLVYCLDCKVFPTRWEPIGVGWRALDKALEQVDERLRARKAAERASRTKNWRDPREIPY